MIGLISQYTLYALFWATLVLVVGGTYLAFLRSKGTAVELAPWLAGLALIASCGPYIGLFGTVWHIIAALSGIGSGNLNVAAIAQPIGQALYATLWGLGCAIPALIAPRVILYKAQALADASAEDPGNAGADA